ncbi:flagellin [Vibrio sp. CAIM 722]|uniref:Flagellin n=1 Tax=Vibrio eleionomae TaxID=2653505 RepID=A0A7X4RTG7_9VIBR|nr:flagellin [Vibrio eleionomae]
MTIGIRSNVAALNAQRYLNKSSGSQEAAMEKLASGNRINNATDDAAGLQISNRLMEQSSGLNMAIQNAHNGISVAQTADGALDETSQLLRNMRDLSLQASNGSNSQDDRKAIQQDVTAINNEINHIAKTTTFAGDLLLNGTYGTKSFQIGNDGGTAVHLHLENMGSDVAMMGGKTFQATKEADQDWEVSSGKNDLSITLSSGDQAQTINISAKKGDDIEELASYINGQTDQLQASVNEHGQLQLFAGNSNVNGSVKITGSLADELGIKQGKDTTVNDIQVTTAGGAQQAVGVIDAALKFVDQQRGQLGALQNRFDHTINNLTKINENIIASNGRIRDTDFAKTTTDMTKDQILSQASSAILAQAKQLPQAALGLLR